MRKPTVLTKCAANFYTEDDERIIEFNDREDHSGESGGLISFRRTENGLVVSVYRCGERVTVRAPEAAPKP